MPAATTTKKRTAKKSSSKSAKKSTKKTTTKKRTSSKASSNGKSNGSYLARGLTAKEFQAEAAKRPIVWNESRIAVVKAMRKLKATEAGKARSADEISKVSGVEPKKVKLHCDVYRGNELVQQGFVKSIKLEGERSLSYYLTASGRKTNFG